MVELCRYLLAQSHEFVLLGEFSTDPLEKEFSKIRQGSGGTYFITVQQVLEKLNITKTKLLFKLDLDPSNFNVEVGHACSKCEYLFVEKISEIFLVFAGLRGKIPLQTKMALVHIAGYVTRYDMPSESELLHTTTFYFHKYGSYEPYTKDLDRGGLKVPTDTSCQWTFFCYIVFNAVRDQVCKQSLSNLPDFNIKYLQIQHVSKTCSNLVQYLFK